MVSSWASFTALGAGALSWRLTIPNGRISGCLPVFSLFWVVIGWIGLYSYAIYLWHKTAIGTLEREIG
jgi:hypothetical protein